MCIRDSSYSGDVTDTSAVLFNGTFNLTTSNSTTGETITITVSDAALDSFDLSSSASGQNGAAYIINQENAYLSVREGGSGTLTITKLDTENFLASGTFEFVGIRESVDVDGNILTETVTVASGEFNNLVLVTQVIVEPNNSLEANVDDEALNADSVTAVAIDLNTTLLITAINNTSNQNIAISMPADITVGTYDFSSLPTQGAIIGQYTPDLGASDTYVSIDGTITITSYDAVSGLMEGSFEFTAGDFVIINNTTYSISDGNFSVEF